MHKRTPVLIALPLVALFSGCLGTGKREFPQRPNIIFIFSDDHAPHAISAYGSKINQTPNIDRLAREGMLFANCFCGNSICGPSRATILTGKHCHANGFMRNGNRFNPMQTTFPKLLQKAGYQTAMIGKWHLTSNPTGFDYWRVLPGQGDYYNPVFITPEGREQIQGYCTEITTDLALKWLKTGRDQSKPFVLMCQHKAPHRSWMPGPRELGMYRGMKIPEPSTLFDNYAGRGRAAANQEMEIDRHMYMYYDLKLEPNELEQKNLKGPDRGWNRLRKRMTAPQLAAWDAHYRPENRAFREANLSGKDLVRWKYQRYIKNYLSCIAGVDKSVGQLLDHVNGDPKLAENTIVIYCSDQGFYLGDNGWYDKRWMYEESLRMPLVVRWPGKIKAGSKATALTQNIDFAPTFLELCGVKAPGDIHGESLVPILKGAKPASWRDAIYYHYYESHAVHMVGAHYGVRTDRYKLMYFYDPENRYWELYDLKTDPNERKSVHDDPKYAKIRDGLKNRLKELRAQYADTTGTVGDFDYAAGVASVDKTATGGLRIRANAWRTYLLDKPDKPLRGTVMLTCTAKPLKANESTGLIVFTGGQPRQRLFRAGIDFKRSKLVIVNGNRVVQSVDVDVPKDRPVTITVQANTVRHGFMVAACGKTLQGKLPKEWTEFTAYGYGLSDGTVEFSKIQAAAR